MAEQQVEEIFQEIRNRVLASERLKSETIRPLPEDSLETVTPEFEYPGLATMERAWDRLPALVTNRHGVSAKIELKVKGFLKKALRWITWEQVNFNSAALHTFRDLIAVVGAQETQIRRLKAETLEQQARVTSLQAQFEAFAESASSINAEQQFLRNEFQTAVRLRREQIELQKIEFASLRYELQAVLQQQVETADKYEAMMQRFGELCSQSETQLATLQSKVTSLEAVRVETETRLINELRERDERMLDEQRVCFKQLSLEASEALVTQDRIRRNLESRLDKLEHRTIPTE
jgi:hypothetical protein